MVKHKRTPITSSNKLTLFLRIGQKQGVTNGEQPHEAFANLRNDDDAAVRNFTRTWGPLAERPMMAQFDWQGILRRAWRGEEAGIKEIQSWVNRYLVTSMEFAEGRINVVPQDLLGTIFILFLRDYLAGKTAICANPDCTQPYFVKHRATQKFCESRACSEFAQRQYAKKWWDDVGKAQREQRRKKAQRGKR